ncbi:MAG: ABC transporter ATP-binding protein [Calditrichota bacterium]
MHDIPAIRAVELTKIYRLGVALRPVEAVRSLNLDVFEGEIFAFLGLNGAGKTTTIKLLLGHARPTRGEAALFGLNVRNPSARARIGYLPDLPHFHRFLTASELLDYTGRLFQQNAARRRSQSERLLKLTGLEGREREPLKGYSRGMLQRIGLAQALMNDPDLVILDEPLGGLDPQGRLELRNIIASLRSEGKTVFFSSHILDDAERIADRVGIIHQGRLRAVGRLDELLGAAQEWDVEIIPDPGLDLEKLCVDIKCSIAKLPEGWILRAPDQESLKTVYGLAAEGRLKINSVNRRRLTLEEAFMKALAQW